MRKKRVRKKLNKIIKKTDKQCEKCKKQNCAECNLFYNLEEKIKKVIL